MWEHRQQNSHFCCRSGVYECDYSYLVRDTGPEPRTLRGGCSDFAGRLACLAAPACSEHASRWPPSRARWYARTLHGARRAARARDRADARVFDSALLFLLAPVSACLRLRVRVVAGRGGRAACQRTGRSRCASIPLVRGGARVQRAPVRAERDCAARRAPAPPVAHDVSACTLFHARAVLPLPRGGRHSRALSRLHMRAPGDDEKPIDVEVAKDELRKASASKVCVRALRRDRAPAPPALLQQWTAGKQHAPPSNSAPCAHARVHTQHHAQRVESVFDVEGLQAGYRFSQSFGPCLELTHILYIYCLSFSQSFGPCL